MLFHFCTNSYWYSEFKLSCIPESGQRASVVLFFFFFSHVDQVKKFGAKAYSI